jgi:hypothetical protein
MCFAEREIKRLRTRWVFAKQKAQVRRGLMCRGQGQQHFLSVSKYYPRAMHNLLGNKKRLGEAV